MQRVTILSSLGGSDSRTGLVGSVSIQSEQGLNSSIGGVSYVKQIGDILMIIPFLLLIGNVDVDEIRILGTISR